MSRTAALFAFVLLASRATAEQCRLPHEMLQTYDDPFEVQRIYESEAGSDRPHCYLYLGDLRRVYLGATRPRFPEAEEAYAQAALALAGKPDTETNASFRSHLERGLVALYERDGLLLWPLAARTTSDRVDASPPLLTLSSVNQYGRSSNEFGNTDETRDLTSEALFSESSLRLDRSLTRDELRDLVRTKEQVHSLNRLRFRRGHWPVIDVRYRFKDLDDAQVTNFFAPRGHNDVEVDEYGFSVEKPLAADGFDALVRGSYSRIDREGLLEFLADADEEIDQLELFGALSGFYGRTKWTVEGTWVNQDISPRTPSFPDRDRDIVAGKITWTIPGNILVGSRPKPGADGEFTNAFELRGLDLFAGGVYDVEDFGVDVRKVDAFVGASLDVRKWRFSLQPTLYRSGVSGDDSQDNAQVQTVLSLLYRIVDEESRSYHMPDPGPFGLHVAFLHVAVVGRFDAGIEGPDDFESYRVGVEAATKLFTSRGTTLLITVGYDHQDFRHLDRDLDLFRVSVGMGF